MCRHATACCVAKSCFLPHKCLANETCASPHGQSASRETATLQGQHTAQDAAFQQEQATARVSNRMSDSATTSAAMQNFDVSSLNPTGNNVRATQQFRQQTQPAGASSGAAAPAATQAAYAFAPAPYDPTAAPQKVAVMNADGSYQVQQPAQSAAACMHTAFSSR